MWESKSDDDVAGECPQEVLIRYFTTFLTSRRLATKSFCILLYIAGKRGLSNCGEYGKPPGHQPGKYGEHCRKHVPIPADFFEQYGLQVVGRCKQTAGRVKLNLPVMPPREQPNAYIKQDSWWKWRLQGMVEDGELPPSSDEHPVVKRDREHEPGKQVVLLSMFCVGVPYAQRDGVVCTSCTCDCGHMALLALLFRAHGQGEIRRAPPRLSRFRENARYVGLCRRSVQHFWF